MLSVKSCLRAHVLKFACSKNKILKIEIDQIEKKDENFYKI